MKNEYIIALISLLVFGAAISTVKSCLRRIHEKDIDKTKPYRQGDLWKVKLADREESGCFEYIIGEYLMDKGGEHVGLIFHFKINGERDHEHTFDAVLIRVLELGENDKFSIREYTEEYSNQEIKLIKQLCDKLHIYFED